MELLTYGLAVVGHGADFAIVENAVVKNEGHVAQEVLEFRVFVVVQLLLYCAEVHRVLNNVQVVRDVQFFPINRFVENPGVFVFPQKVYQSLGCLVP